MADESLTANGQVNIDSIRALLDVARRSKTESGELIKFIFTSSLAVYGGPLPDVVDSSTIATPEGAYGTGKLISEYVFGPVFAGAES